MLRLSGTFENALIDAKRIHIAQVRKGNAIPYFAHLMSVSALVLEDGGTEEEAIAALFHDAAEDQGGKPMLGLIAERYDSHVAGIVEECSDTFESPKPAWKKRKQDYIDHLDVATLSACRVCAADKLHNARSIIADAHAGEDVFARFSATPEETVWYYQEVAAKLFARLPESKNVHELMRAVGDLQDLIAMP